MYGTLYFLHNCISPFANVSTSKSPKDCSFGGAKTTTALPHKISLIIACSYHFKNSSILPLYCSGT